MPKIKINKSNIDKNMPFVAKGTVDYWDTGDGSIKGFAVRVGASSKTFFVQVDIPAPQNEGKKYKTVKSIIGKYGLFTAEDARNEAKDRIQRLKQGKDATEKEAITLKEMLEKHLSLKDFSDNTRYGYKLLSKKFETWFDMTIDSVSELEPTTVIERFKQIEKDNGKMAARNSFATLRALMNHAKILYPKHVKRNPCDVLSDGKYWPIASARTDCLRGNDFKQFYNGIQALNEVTRDAYLFALYIGCRNIESASLKWEYVDMDNAILNIPTTKSKNPLHIPLSKQSMEILKRRKEHNPEGEYVFPTQRADLNKTGHVVLVSAVLKLRTGLDITVHGLRRSFIDIADNKLKLRRQDVDRLTNHADNSVTGVHYSHKDVEDLRTGIQSVCNEIERLMLNGVGAKVIDLATGRTAA